MRAKDSLGILLVVLLLSSFGLLWAKTLVEFDFERKDELNKWEFLEPDRVELKKSDPPEYGPGVLVIKDTATDNRSVGFVKDFKLKDGIIEVLWKDAALPEDTDGPLLAKCVEYSYNNGYLLELDTDAGLHLCTITAGNESQIAGPGQMSDDKWKWIKWRFEGKNMKVKAWPAGEKEPDKWELDVDDDTYEEGYVGFRVWSGTAEIAFYRVTDLEGPSVAVELREKLATAWGKIKSF